MGLRFFIFHDTNSVDSVCVFHPFLSYFFLIANFKLFNYKNEFEVI